MHRRLCLIRRRWRRHDDGVGIFVLPGEVLMVHAVFRADISDLVYDQVSFVVICSFIRDTSILLFPSS